MGHRFVGAAVNLYQMGPTWLKNGTAIEDTDAGHFILMTGWDLQAATRPAMEQLLYDAVAKTIQVRD